MSISTFGELKTAVASELDRGDLTSKIPEFIAIAESFIKQDVRIRDQEKRVTASISTEYFDLPTDYLEIRDIQINSDPVGRLAFLSSPQMDTFYTGTGKPKAYAIFGTEVQFKPVPDTTYTVEIAYISKYTAFSADNDTNYLLTNHPEIYLYASCISGADFLEDQPKIEKYTSLYQAAVKKLNDSEKKANYGASIRRRAS